MAPDLLSTIRAEIAERLEGLRPLVAEHERLLVAAEALEATHGAGKRVGVTPSGAASPRGRRAKRADVAPSEAPDVAEDVLGSDPVETVAETRSRVRTKRSAAKADAKVARGAVRGVARETILAALEHGSHTVGELSVVTAMTAPNINGSLRRLASEGVVVKTEREGKTAWSLVELAV